MSAPFNLLKEVESIASGTHGSFVFTTESDREDAKNLFMLLASLPAENEKAEYTSIDIEA